MIPASGSLLDVGKNCSLQTLNDTLDFHKDPQFTRIQPLLVTHQNLLIGSAVGISKIYLTLNLATELALF